MVGIVPCAQTRCQGLSAIEMHSRARVSGTSAVRLDRPAQQATEPRAKREAMRTLPLHGEFEQLLLACDEGCGLHYNSIGSKFGAAFICACALYYQHYSLLLFIP